MLGTGARLASKTQSLDNHLFFSGRQANKPVRRIEEKGFKI